MNYETKILHLDNGNSFEYINYMNTGTWFLYGQNIKNKGWEHKENKKLWTLLALLVHTDKRIRIWYGDTETGRSWNDEYDIIGTIGRSNGAIKIPILLNNSRSRRGTGLLDFNIIRIDDIKAKRTIYKLKNFHVEEMKIETVAGTEYPYRVMQYKDSKEVQNVANFKDKNAALRWIDFMNGKRYRK